MASEYKKHQCPTISCLYLFTWKNDYISYGQAGWLVSFKYTAFLCQTEFRFLSVKGNWKNTFSFRSSLLKSMGFGIDFSRGRIRLLMVDLPAVSVTSLNMIRRYPIWQIFDLKPVISSFHLPGSCLSSY